jgi:ketosteroid isomerase-like protein
LESFDTTTDVAQRLKSALETSDLASFADLLSPDVRWGPPDSSPPPCTNKQQVLAWYRRGAAANASALVTEMMVIEDRVVVGLAIQGMKSRSSRGETVSRWQVFTLRDGLIVEIVGFDSRADAAARAGLLD